MENKKSKNWTLYAIIAACAAPMLLSYLFYYVVKPSGRTNFGTLLDPRQYPMPDLHATTLDGKPKGLESLKGKWLLLQTDSGNCLQQCQDKLVDMRQLRLMQGKEADRVERVWLINDQQALDIPLMKTYDGTYMLRADAAAIKSWLPAEDNRTAADHVYIVDPLGNLIMRYHAEPDAELAKCRVEEELARSYGVDPKRACQVEKISKDLNKLLKASSIG